MSYILDALKRAEAEREQGAVPGLHARQVPAALAHTDAGARSRRWLLATALAALVFGGMAAGLWVWRAPVQDARQAVVQAAVVAVPVPARALPITSLPPPAAPTPRVVAASPPTPAPVPTPAANLSPEPVAPVALPLLGDLPHELRRQIPPLTITGVVYSENPGQRLLLVNNQVLTQGSLVAPELTLEEIQPKSSVLVFRGTRFRVAH